MKTLNDYAKEIRNDLKKEYPKLTTQMITKTLLYHMFKIRDVLQHVTRLRVYNHFTIVFMKKLSIYKINKIWKKLYY